MLTQATHLQAKQHGPNRSAQVHLHSSKIATGQAYELTVLGEFRAQWTHSSTLPKDLLGP